MSDDRKATTDKATMDEATTDKPTMEQLRGVIGSDGDANSVGKPPPAPAASRLGTDDEAGGTTPTRQRIEMARKAEQRIHEAAGNRQRNDVAAGKR